MSDPEPKDKEKPAKKPKGGRLIALATVLNLGGTGFIVFKLLTTKPPHAAAAAAGHAQPPPLSGQVSGPVVKLDPFVVNLNEAEPRYLKVTVELELATGEAARAVDKGKQVVRDRVLSYLSNLTLSDTLGEQGKAKIRADLVARLDELLGEGRVKRMFFSEFVVQ